MLAADDENDVSDRLKDELVDLFFTWQNPWMHIVDETLFRDSRKTQGRYHSPLLEYCVLGHGSLFTDRPEVRSDPDDETSAGKLFYEKAQLFLHFDLKWPSLTTIQSLLLLSTLHVVSVKDP